MSTITVGVIGILLVLVLIFTKMKVAYSMLIVGFVGLLYLQGWKFTENIMGLLPYSQTALYSMSPLPVFIFMGIILSVSGLGQDLFVFASRWLGRIKGSLAMATAIACGFFAAVCGDSITTAVTMGKVCYPEMKKHNYSDRLAGAVIACGGTVGILIPPSMCFIIYGTITETSVGKLFMAGLIPGILQVLFYVIVVSILVHMKKDMAPMPVSYPLKEKLKATKPIWPVLLLFGAIIGGLYVGVFTPTEAGAGGAFCAFVICLLLRRLDKAKILETFNDTLKTTATMFLILVGAYVFMRFMTMSGLPQAMGAYVINLNTVHNVPALVILILIIVMYIILGAFMDVFASILLTLPIIFPIVTALGYDAIWFGVIITRMMEFGLITPPFGVNLFMISKTTGVKIKDLYKGVIPFLIGDTIHVIILIIFPQIALWLAR
ncbi:MAG: TRAP transporter large permease [Clostridiales Family XIII bacterium]|jgi:tripartite ATP-independent transporter DctM subunit|nr:TRAP transporter large permease [Clostridiales Family XIII bacterium]